MRSAPAAPPRQRAPTNGVAVHRRPQLLRVGHQLPLVQLNVARLHVHVGAELGGGREEAG